MSNSTFIDHLLSIFTHIFQRIDGDNTFCNSNKPKIAYSVLHCTVRCTSAGSMISDRMDSLRLIIY